MNNLIDNKGSIKKIQFTCIVRNEEYKIIATFNQNTENKWDDNIWNTKDTIKRLSDGLKKTLTREQLKTRFKNIK